MSLASGLYRGVVAHVRFRPRAHRLRYRAFMMLLDVDELKVLDARLRLFSYNRPGLLSFHDTDHGAGRGYLRTWVHEALRSQGIEPPGGAIRLLCMPRVLGRVFNPLSIYFCWSPEGRLAAIVYEVNNTFGERHSYVLPVTGEGAVVEQSCPKRLHVSPFMDMDMGYDFRIAPPGETASVTVGVSDGDGTVLTASFVGRRIALTDGALLRVWLGFPLLAAQVLGAIHFEALKLWLKGVRLRPKPAAPVAEFSGKA